MPKGDKENDGEGEEMEVDGEEANDSRIDCALGNFSDLLKKAMENKRGQKGLIKSLYADREDVVEQCEVALLKRAAFEPSFITCEEGRKLAAAFIPKIGVKDFWTIARDAIAKDETTKSRCESFGKIFIFAWKNAKDTEDEALRTEIEFDLLTDVVYYAICTHTAIARKFYHVLQPLKQTKGTLEKQLSPMIGRILEPNLWRSLKANNEFYRYNAFQLLMLFYPIASDGSIESEELQIKQCGAVRDLLLDSCSAIRSEMARWIPSVLASYWPAISTDFKVYSMKTLVDTLSRDKVAAVRVAVYEGLAALVPCASALNLLEEAIKCVAKNGINDVNDKVRVATCQLLCVLKRHRFIKFWDVIDMNKLIQRFGLESSPMVLKAFTKLLLESYLPEGKGADEIVKRAIALGEKSRRAALSFYRYARHMITVEQAVDYISTLALATYKVLRPTDQFSSFSTSADMNDSTATIATQACTAAVVVDAEEDDNSDGAKRWRQTCLLLECVIVMWSSLKKSIMEEKYAQKRTRLTRLLIKLFKLVFASFKNSSLKESIMILGSMLNDEREMWQVSNSVLKELLCSPVMDEKMLPLYIEAVAAWNLDKILLFVDSALTDLQSKYSDSSQFAKKRRKELPEGSVDRALIFLETMLKSATVVQNLRENHIFFLTRFYTSLSVISIIIETKLKLATKQNISPNLPEFSTKSVLCALQLRHTIAAILTSVVKEDDDRISLLRAVDDDLTSLFTNLFPLINADMEDERRMFLLSLCEAFLNLASFHLEYASQLAKFKTTLCNSLPDLLEGAPHSLIVPLLKMLKCAYRSLYTNEGADTARKLSVLIRPCLLWMISCCADDDYDAKSTAESFLSFLMLLHSRGQLTSEDISTCRRIIVTSSVSELAEKNAKDLDVCDPRDHNFEVGPVVSLLVHRILFKNRILQNNAVLSFLDYALTSSDLERLHGIDLLYVYGAHVQFLILSDLSAANVARGSTAVVPKPLPLTVSARKRAGASTLACMQKIMERLESVPKDFRNEHIYEQIVSIMKASGL